MPDWTRLACDIVPQVQLAIIGSTITKRIAFTCPMDMATLTEKVAEVFCLRQLLFEGSTLMFHIADIRRIFLR